MKAQALREAQREYDTPTSPLKEMPYVFISDDETDFRDVLDKYGPQMWWDCEFTNKLYHFIKE